MGIWITSPCAVHYVYSHVGGGGVWGHAPSGFCVCFSGILGGKIHCFHCDSAETKQLRQIPPQLNYTQHTIVFYLSRTLLIRITLVPNLVMYRLCSWEINYGVYPCVAILPFLRGNFPTVLLNYTWQADSASCSQGLSSITNAQKDAASTLFLCTDTDILQHMTSVHGSVSGSFIWLNLKRKAFFMQGCYGT